MINIKLKHAELLKAIREYLENNSNLIDHDGVPENASIVIYDDGAGEFAASIQIEENTLP